MTTLLFILWQCSWGFLQTALGFIVFLAHLGDRHYLCRGGVVTEWKRPVSASLGLFLFLTQEQSLPKEEQTGVPPARLSERLLVHEYGHAVQSLILGPLYLFVIGLPSALWCLLPCCQKRREREGISYYSFYPERWADRLGARTLGRRRGDRP